MAERNPSKQRRAAQNKAQREALATRKARAAEPKPERAPVEERAEPAEAGEVAEAPATPRRSRFRAKAAPTATGRPSRAAPARAPTPTRRATAPASKSTGKPAASGARPARKPLEKGPDTPEEPGLRGFLADVQQVAGGKAVLFALIFALVAAGTILFGSVIRRQVLEVPLLIIEKVNKGRTGTEPATDTVTLLEAVGPIGFAYAAVPVAICAMALEATRRPNRRRAFTIAAFALGLYVVFFSVFGIFFFFSMAALFFAAWQARKADPPVRVPRGRAARQDEEADDDED